VRRFILHSTEKRKCRAGVGIRTQGQYGAESHIPESRLLGHYQASNMGNGGAVQDSERTQGQL
jgi:hypothetical protein